MTTHRPAHHDADADARYTEGSCHVFAVALHRHLGFRLLAVVDYSAPHWEDPDDADNTLPTVWHVYAVDGDGTAWDVRGARPASAVLAEWPDAPDACDEDMADEAELAPYVDGGPGDDADRPLAAYDDAAVAAAWAAAQRLLADLLPAPAPRLRS